MYNSAFISKAIGYQKTATDQMFALMSQYQSNTEELLQKTLDQCTWLPGISKESYLRWSASYLESTQYLKGMVDTGFEQVEQVFASPVIKDTTEKKPQASGQNAAPSQKAASRKKTRPQPKKTVSKATPSKAKAPVQKAQASKSASTAASAESVPKTTPAKGKTSAAKSPASKSPAQPVTTSVSVASAPKKAEPSISKTPEQKSQNATSESDVKPSTKSNS